MVVQAAERTIALLPSPLLLWVKSARTDQERQVRFHLCSEFVSLWPFRLGMLARRVFYRRTLARCGTNPVIRMGAVFVYPQAELGDNVLIGTHCVIGLATVGDHVLFAHHVSLLSARHHHRRGDGASPQIRDGVVERVHIGSHVWLGAASTIMADVGDNAIVGAGAVVVKPVPPGVTVAGNPARVLDGPEAAS